MRSKTASKIVLKISSIKTPYALNIDYFDLIILESVYPPGEETLFLAKFLKENNKIKPGEKVLDYGTGSGFLALIAARLGAKVLAVDINPKSIECAKINTDINNLNCDIECRLGESFETIKDNEIFDVILANLPYEDALPANLTEFSVYDSNFKMRKQMFEKAKSHLTENGSIFFTYSKRVQDEFPIESFAKGYKIKLISELRAKDEIYYLYLIRK